MHTHIAEPGARELDMPLLFKRFELPDERRDFELGKFELVVLGEMTIGRATYQPGWKWSKHVGPGLGLSRCSGEHVGLVLRPPRLPPTDVPTGSSAPTGRSSK